MSQSDDADRIIDNLMGYSQLHGDLLNKFDLQFFLGHFDRNTIMAMADHIPSHQQLTAQDFIRLFLLRIQHQEDETIYLALSLKRLFDSILERTAKINTIQFSDFTTYLCEKISKDDLDVVIPLKNIPKEKLVPDSQRIREIDLQPALVISKVRKQIPKISKDQPRRNKKLQQKRTVSKFFFSKQHQQIIAVGTLSSSIYIYDQQLKKRIQIRPNECREMQKDIGILSMAYSSRSNRIGALLTNASMIFWEGVDNFNIEKVIGNKSYGDKIYHLELSNEWITVDRSRLYFWDIKEEAITQTITVPQSVLITDICEINHLRAICLSTVTARQQKILLIYHQGKKVARINLQNSGCHSLHYNKLTQSLIPLGYHNTVQVYTVEGAQFDVQLKFILRGHKSIITCIDSMQNSSLMITGDDMGQIRIWQLTYMRCVQSVKITKWLGNIRLVGNNLFYSDSRINVMKLDRFEIPEAEKLYAIQQFYDQKQDALWVITRKDARKVDIKKGKIRNIFMLCGEEDDISAAAKLGDGFVIGNSKGQLFHYDSDCNLRWEKQAHQGQIRQLLFDQKNRLIFSLGAEGKIIIWPQRNTAIEGERKSISFKTKQINLMATSSKSNMMIIGNTSENDFSIWDYQVLKLYQVMQMDGIISAMLISQFVDLIIIASASQTLTFLKFEKKDPQLQMKLLYQFNYREYLISKKLMVEGQTDSVICLELVIIEQTKYQLIAASSKGVLFSLDITSLVNSNFTPVFSSFPKDSVNILRNQRQQYESSLSQRGNKRAIQTLRLQDNIETTINVNWAIRVCKEAISCVQSIPMRQNILGVVCHDYSKLINSSNGHIQASLNINHPLPVKWDVKLDKHSLLKKNVYQILKLIDSILRNNGYQMLARQYKMINITKFMEMIKNKNFNQRLPTPHVELLSSQFQPEDMLITQIPEASLKALQAYKRVKMIKKMSEESMIIPPVSPQSNKEAQIDKEYISHLLSPDRFNTFQKSSTQRELMMGNILTGRLLQNLNPLSQLKKISKSNVSLQEGNNRTYLQRLSSKPNSIMKDIANISGLSKSINFYKEKSILWKQKCQEKGIKQILGDLNSKLRSCRQKHNRNIEL